MLGNLTLYLWILAPAALFLTLALYVLSIGLRTRNVDLRSEAPAPADTGSWPVLLTHRGLNRPRT